MSDLHEIPQTIAQIQRQALVQEGEIRYLKATLTTFDREIEGTIAFDAELKNESQRKAKKAELQSEEDYQALSIKLQRAQDGLIELQIELELLRSQLSILKLEMRGAIARLEAEAA